MSLEATYTAIPGNNTALSLAFSHIGYVRNSNQDCYLDLREQGLWAVADGMGGHHHGDVAARTVIEALADFRTSPDLKEVVEDVCARLQLANTRCREKMTDEVSGATVTVLLWHGQFQYALWAGDSRVYRLRDEQLERLTADHNLGREARARGIAQALPKRQQQVLTRAIGIRDHLEIETQFSTLADGDIYLVCTDGLYRALSRPRLTRILNQYPLPQAAAYLRAKALASGAYDNLTGIFVQHRNGVAAKMPPKR